jgi:hypothetical protein
MIAVGPQRWPRSLHGTRKFLLHRFPFAAVYRELPSVIQVLTVAPPIGGPATGKIGSSRTVIRDRVSRAVIGG